MGQEFTLQQSPLRTAHGINTPIPTYGEGEWTPVLRFGGATTGITYGAYQDGYWVRTGNLITAFFRILLTSKGSETGIAGIGGFPFNGTTFQGKYVATFGGFNSVWWDNMTSSFVNILCSPTNETGSSFLYGATAAATDLAFLFDTDFSNTTGLAGRVIYVTQF